MLCGSWGILLASPTGIKNDVSIENMPPILSGICAESVM